MMLAYIEADYQRWLGYIENRLEEAARKRDAIAMRYWQQELERANNAKGAEIDAENARHEWAIAACTQ